LTFSSRKTGQQVRFQNRQVDVKSVAQEAQRSDFLKAVAGWHDLTESQQQEFENRSKELFLNMTGYNLFILEVLTGVVIVGNKIQSSDGKTYIITNDDHTIEMFQNEIKTLEMLNGGILSLPKGQIKFPATQVASADANTLDDYEEGTWTGTVTVAYGFTAGGSATLNGNYIKIGDMVTVTCSIDFDTSETFVVGDRFIISGLPFLMTGGENGVGGGSFIQPGSFFTDALAVGTVASNSNNEDQLQCVVTRIGSPPALNATNVNLGITYRISNSF
jgi:hypothetical protein